MAKALNQNGLDSKGRKLGERPGLDKPFSFVKENKVKYYKKKVLNTPLVQAVNDAHLVLQILRESVVP